MRYPDYEDLLAKARPVDVDPVDFEQDLIFDETDLESLLTDSGKQEQNRIETELDQVESLFQHRDKIHEQTVDELENAVQDERERLERLQRPSVPADRIAGQKRRVRELERKMQEVRRIHWRDRETLERDQRRLRRELSELQDTDLSLFF
jgi:hypothetical protein